MGNAGENRTMAKNGFIYACRLDSDAYGYGPVARCCECVDEVLVFVNDKENFDQQDHREEAISLSSSLMSNKTCNVRIK
jgi:hypothetical protein